MKALTLTLLTNTLIALALPALAAAAAASRTVQCKNMAHSPLTFTAQIQAQTLDITIATPAGDDYADRLTGPVHLKFETTEYGFVRYSNLEVPTRNSYLHQNVEARFKPSDFNAPNLRMLFTVSRPTSAPTQGGVMETQYEMMCQ